MNRDSGELSAVLREIGIALGEDIVSSESIAGGDINDAYRLELGSGSFLFVKLPPRDVTFDDATYRVEAHGLRWLAEAGTLRVPRVERATAGWLALEYVPRGRPASDYDDKFGRGLAELHRSGAPQWGLSYDNFIGPFAQPNRQCVDWPTFYVERRLAPQLAEACSTLGAPIVSRFEHLCADIVQVVGPPEPPARLHGDLWAGNAFADANGSPVLVDPAVYGGHREVDLAMMQLFGGFSERVFAAYDEAYPLAAGWRGRVPLYQLYPLLVHVNLFGAGYVRQLEATLARVGK